MFTQLFGRAPTILTRAPGRVEFIGNHTDYNGGEVLGAAIDREIRIALAPRADTCVRFRTAHNEVVVEVDLLDFAAQPEPSSWANYPLGVIREFQDAGVAMPHGFDLLVTSTLPTGAGLSSSAAFELATALALQTLYGSTFDTLQLALLSQRAENNFVGMPCGLLDQGVSAFGTAAGLVHLDCATQTIQPVTTNVPLAFWVFNTNCKHSLVEGEYAVRRQECERALAVLQTAYPEAKFLCDLSPEQVEVEAHRLEPVVLQRARHVTTENARVKATVKALAGDDLDAVGAMIAASHASSRDDFGNSTHELDTLAELLNAHDAVYGARLTGGGFGGAVLAMVKPDFGETEAAAIVEAYQAKRPSAPVPTALSVKTTEGASLLDA